LHRAIVQAQRECVDMSALADISSNVVSVIRDAMLSIAVLFIRVALARSGTR
jgi:hypothetical protein